MKKRTEIRVNGKLRMVIEKYASGEDKVKEAILKVMGSDWEFKDFNKKRQFPGRGLRILSNEETKKILLNSFEGEKRWIRKRKMVL